MITTDHGKTWSIMWGVRTRYIQTAPVVTKKPKRKRERPSFITDAAMFDAGFVAGQQGVDFEYPDPSSNAQANDYRAGFVRGRDKREAPGSEAGEWFGR